MAANTLWFPSNFLSLDGDGEIVDSSISATEKSLQALRLELRQLARKQSNLRRSAAQSSIQAQNANTIISYGIMPLNTTDAIEAEPVVSAAVGTGYYFGGFGMVAGSVLRDIFGYEFDKRSVLASPLTLQRATHDTCVISSTSKAYIPGGTEDSRGTPVDAVILQNIQVFDYATRVTVAGGVNLSEPSHSLSGVGNQTKGLILGGRNATPRGGGRSLLQHFTLAEIDVFTYSPESITRAGSSLNTSRTQAATGGNDAVGFVFSGANNYANSGDNPTDTIEEISFASVVPIELGTRIDGRIKAAAAGDKVNIFIGPSSGQKFSGGILTWINYTDRFTIENKTYTPLGFVLNSMNLATAAISSGIVGVWSGGTPHGPGNEIYELNFRTTISQKVGATLGKPTHYHMGGQPYQI